MCRSIPAYKKKFGGGGVCCTRAEFFSSSSEAADTIGIAEAGVAVLRARFGHACAD